MFGGQLISNRPLDCEVSLSYHSLIYNDPDSHLFQLQLKVAKIAIDTIAKLAEDPEYVDAVPANASGALAETSKDQSEDVFEKLEVQRNEKLTEPVTADILKSSVILNGGKTSRDRLGDHLLEAIKRHPEFLSVFRSRKPISTDCGNRAQKFNDYWAKQQRLPVDSFDKFGVITHRHALPCLFLSTA